MKNKKLTIEQLSEKLNGSLWVKGEIKRIYLNDAGYNTKKMSTKTYVFQKDDGNFAVSCYIDCPSQSFQWIKSQQLEIISGIEKDIQAILSDTVYIMTDKNGNIVNYKGEIVSLDLSTHYFLENDAKNSIGDHHYSAYIAMDRKEFDKKCEELSND